MSTLAILWLRVRMVTAVLWSWITGAASWLWRKLGARGVAFLVVVAAIVLVAMGWKELRIGGVLGKLLGKKPAQAAIDVVNSVPAHRVDAKGNVIPPGTPDSTGQTQAVVVPIKDPGLFSDPSTVTFTSPGDEKPTTVTLPTGVTNKSVDKVIVVQPSVVAVAVKDGTGVSASTIDDLLKKYGARP